MDDVGRLVADLDRFLDELGEPRARRRPRVEQHVRRLTAAQRLRLAGALHLLSGRLDGDLAHPDVPSQGASSRSAGPYGREGAENPPNTETGVRPLELPREFKGSDPGF